MHTLTKRVVGVIAVVLLNACARVGDSAQTVQSGSALADSAEFIARNLATFDTLDLVVFSHQLWDRLSESHAQDIVVTWPDGHDTHGLTRHIADLKAMFVAIPDLAITEHPIRIANGSWTAVVGRMTGTFSKPMPMAGKMIAPTDRKLDLSMVTIGHWTNSGVMDHEWLFWDNAAYMKQLGLNP